MPYLIGQKRTPELLLTSDLIDAVEAERIGLVNSVEPLDQLAAEVDALADRLARTPHEVMGPTKRMLNTGRWTRRVPAGVASRARSRRHHHRRGHAGAARMGRDRPLRRPQGRPSTGAIAATASGSRRAAAKRSARARGRPREADRRGDASPEPCLSVGSAMAPEIRCSGIGMRRSPSTRPGQDHRVTIHRRHSWCWGREWPRRLDKKSRTECSRVDN